MEAVKRIDPEMQLLRGKATVKEMIMLPFALLFMSEGQLSEILHSHVHASDVYTCIPALLCWMCVEHAICHLLQFRKWRVGHSKVVSVFHTWSPEAVAAFQTWALDVLFKCQLVMTLSLATVTKTASFLKTVAMTSMNSDAMVIYLSNVFLYTV